jgi:hypothetical protein
MEGAITSFDALRALAAGRRGFQSAPTSAPAAATPPTTNPAMATFR